MLYSQNMAEQKELFMTNGEFVEGGSCGSPFCNNRNHCQDNGAGKGSTDPLTIWQNAYDEFPNDPEKAAAQARELYEAETSIEVAPIVTDAQACALRAVTRKTIEVRSGEYL